ncbi:MAG TPA: hypothetical protein VKP60_01835 [Magnetospirillaceae bacterium]|nr:hypothetical protein [Magnetospirillaceae bacterium]
MTAPTEEKQQNAAAPAARKQSISTLRDFVIVAFYYRKMVSMIVGAGFVLAVIVFIFSPVHFTAHLQLMVVGGAEAAQAAGISTGNTSTDTTRLANSEAEFLHNRAFLSTVAEAVGPTRIDPSLGRRRWFGLRAPLPEDEQLNAAVDTLERALWVTTPTDTNLLIVSFQHKDRETAIQTVDTLAEVYLQRRREIYSNDKSPFLRDKARTYGKQLDAIESAIKTEKEQNNILDLTQETTIALDHVAATNTALNNAQQRQAALIASIAAAQSKISQMPPQVFDFAEKTDRVDNDDTDNILMKLRIEQDHLQQLYQDSDPHLSDVNRQIDILEEAKKRPHREFTESRQVRNPAIDFITNHLVQDQVESEALAHNIDELKAQVTAAQARVEQLRNAEAKLKNLERSRGVTDQLYRDFTQKAEATQSDEAASAQKNDNIRVVANGDASLKGESSRLNLFLATLIASVIIAVASSLMADWNRQVFLLPAEIEARLNLPVLATFNEGQDLLAQGVAAQIIYLAGQLTFHRGAQGGTLQVMQVASQGRNEDRSQVALALATEMAAGQGLRTLLLDLVGEGVDQWTALGQPKPTREIGGFKLAESTTPKLDVSLGAPYAEINWLRANKSVLETLIAELAHHYDMVIVDSPAFRDGVVPVRLANVVQGSIMVVRAEHTKLSVVENMVGQLLGAGGDLYGAIMTGRRFYIPWIIYRWL